MKAVVCLEKYQTVQYEKLKSRRQIDWQNIVTDIKKKTGTVVLDIKDTWWRSAVPKVNGLPFLCGEIMAGSKLSTSV